MKAAPISLATLAVAFISSTLCYEYDYPDFCPDVMLKPDFDFGKFRGKWYEWRHSMTLSHNCSVQELNVDETESELTSKSRTLNMDGTEDIKDWFLRIDDSERPKGKALVLFDKEKHFSVYYILETDYDTFSIEYACYNLNGRKNEYLWVMARKEHLELSKEIEGIAMETMKKNKISLNLNDVVGRCKEYYSGV